MRVRMRTTYAGPLGTFGAGAIADLPRADADGLIERGYAVQDDGDAAAAETADMRASETADTAANRRRRK